MVISNRTTHPREGAYRPIHMLNLQYVAVMKDSQIVGCTPLEIYSQITWYYITRRSSAILKGKGLKVPYKYNYYRGPTKDPALIRDPPFIFVVMLFPPATKPD